MKKNSGQVFTELALILPLLLMGTALGYDFGNLGFTQERMNQAAYEATKTLPQLRSSPLICNGDAAKKAFSVANNVPCIDEVMISRAERMLIDTGMKKAGDSTPAVQFLQEVRNIPGEGAYTFMGLKITHNYGFFGKFATTQLKSQFAVAMRKEDTSE